LQYIIAGITIGAVYTLIAIGFNIIYSTTRIVNFAQGEFFMLGGMIEFFLLQASIPLSLSLIITCFSVSIIASFVYKIFIANAKNSSDLSLIIMTVGIAMILRGITGVLTDKNAHPVKDFLPFSSVSMFGVSFASQYIIVIAAAIILIIVLYFYFSKTFSGKIMQAVAANPLAATLFGTDTQKVKLFSFAISGFVGAMAGAIIAPISFAQYDSGLMFGLKGFAASVVGGFGNNTGALIGGLCIGIVESLSAGYVSSAYKDAAAFVIMIIILFIRPQGIFSSKDIERV